MRLHTIGPARRLFGAATASALLALAACSQPMASALPPLPAGAGYVAMGSSYAAGPGIGPVRPGTPARCARATNNYASLLAEALHLALVDASCSGATSAHLLGPWQELAPQIDAVTADTRLVTVTIGGNDLGFVTGLFAASCRAGSVPGPCPAAPASGESQYAELEARLHALARAVHARAPAATLVFVQYLTVVPPAPCDRAAIAPQDARAAAAVARRLAAITARVAAGEGARLLAADRLSRDHTPCSPEPWSNGFRAGYDMRQGAPWHPNAAGHAAIARALAAMLAPSARL